MIMGHPLLAIEPKPTKPFRITFTGADDQTSIQDMLALVKDYPMVEFGILFSPKRTGTARYPSLEWLEREVFPNADNLALAAHLCGGDSKEVLETGKSKHDFILSWYFDRVQLNTTAQDIDYRMVNDWAVSNFVFPILQCRGPFPDVKDVLWLYDVSGGEGITPDSWPEPLEHDICGYAGGLRKENILSVVNQVGLMSTNYWLDMESGVRDAQGNFSIDMCREICELVFDN